MDNKVAAWPDDFDFETDEMCQSIFKPFIKEEMRKLEAYDDQRPDDITYIFHEHTDRVAENIYRCCMALGLGERVANNMRWAVMPQPERPVLSSPCFSDIHLREHLHLQGSEKRPTLSFHKQSEECVGV